MVGEDIPKQSRESYLCGVLGVLSGCLQDVVGIAEARGYLSVVGHTVGEKVNQACLDDHGCERLSRDQMINALVDFKNRVGGGFEIASTTAETVEFHNCRCPFGDQVKGRPSLCMMTSAIFGYIAAESMGYARVELLETIALGNGRCVVRVNFDPETGGEGVEFYRVKDLGLLTDDAGQGET